MGRAEGKIALITGAGMGLGLASATLLAREGAALILTDISPPDLEKAVATLRAAGATVRGIVQDTSSPEDWARVEADVRSTEGRLDVLVNNAGIAPIGTIESCDMEQWRRCMAVNADGVFLGCKTAVALMKGQGGSIVNLSSIDGIIGEADLAAYCASKGAVRTLTKAVAVHCAEQGYGIRCNSIHPGYIWTPQTENYLAGLGRLEAEKAKALSRHPIGRLGKPEDIAYMVLYLASDESSFVTGAEMVVDGGYLMV
ncbi:glucose 1-dehydrogenase [Rhodobacter sp. SGA-6-6]|uniref:glucose 1-dehydrogenase n=1 Tax=Rhodobacter sp. SGA-6-6 TaxID=2710882 RepID=UPI0013EC534F|nr:glucose 1-dehydrogenase [Rhodobacter sp. SGA-6-6]NGM45860.1 glucose 1-dehydrogenase [Rhodobacter sp. SGA-6-6]